MSRARVLLLALAGLAVPACLALGIYVASESSLAAVPTVVQAPATIASPPTTTGAEPGPATTQPTTTTAGEDDDLPGKCRKPENALDPDCDPRSADGRRRLERQGLGRGRRRLERFRLGWSGATTTRAVPARVGAVATTTRAATARATTTNHFFTVAPASLHHARGRPFPGPS